MDGLAFGIFVNAVGAVLTNLGTVLIKYHAAVRQDCGSAQKIGIFSFCLGNLLTFSSFSFAPQSLLAGVSAVQFVSNIFFAKIFLGEDICSRNISGTVLIIVSVTVLVATSRDVKKPADYTLDEWFASFQHNSGTLRLFEVLLVSTPILCFTFWFRTGTDIFLIGLKKMKNRLTWELGQPRSKGRFARVWLPFNFILPNAAIGAQSAVFGKLLSLVVNRATLHGQWFELVRPRTILALVAWVFTASLWVVQLDRALRLFPGGFVVPLTQVCWIICTMVSGGVVYDEFDRMTSTQQCIFVWSTLALLLGVYFLSPLDQPRPVATPTAVPDKCYVSIGSTSDTRASDGYQRGATSVATPVWMSPGFMAAVSIDAAVSTWEASEERADPVARLPPMLSGEVPLGGYGFVSEEDAVCRIMKEPPYIIVNRYIESWLRKARESEKVRSMRRAFVNAV
ncbi:NIPA-like protein 3 [Perkinsus chesapeaki]|uniref:NIPA-like protein 3 n=1 Tax=Perkinsus chesapeaki TaxID=330153 RepID=A0A7J6M9G9_PERCH|nr:NIPA-like protein 3 [Perkinsus chesapeaki]